MTVQVGEIFDLHRFLFSEKGGLYMPDQSVRHQKETDSDQQITIHITQICKGDTYESNRQCCTGRIQCRN